MSAEQGLDIATAAINTNPYSECAVKLLITRRIDTSVLWQGKARPERQLTAGSESLLLFNQIASVIDDSLGHGVRGHGTTGHRLVATHSGPRRLSAVGNLIFAELALSALPRRCLILG